MCLILMFISSVQKNTQYVLIFDAFVIVICLASLILCTRSIVLAVQLRKVSACSVAPSQPGWALSSPGGAFQVLD